MQFYLYYSYTRVQQPLTNICFSPLLNGSLSLVGAMTQLLKPTVSEFGGSFHAFYYSKKQVKTVGLSKIVSVFAKEAKVTVCTENLTFAPTGAACVEQQ